MGQDVSGAHARDPILDEGKDTTCYTHVLVQRGKDYIFEIKDPGGVFKISRRHTDRIPRKCWRARLHLKISASSVPSNSLLSHLGVRAGRPRRVSPRRRYVR